MIGLAVISLAATASAPPPGAEAFCDQARNPRLAEQAEPGGLVIGPACGDDGRCSFGPPDAASARNVLLATGAPFIAFATPRVWGSHTIVRLGLTPSCEATGPPEGCLRLIDETSGEVATEGQRLPELGCVQMGSFEPCGPSGDRASVEAEFRAIEWPAPYYLTIDTSPQERHGHLGTQATIWRVRRFEDEKILFEADSIALFEVRPLGSGHAWTRAGSCGAEVGPVFGRPG